MKLGQAGYAQWSPGFERSTNSSKFFSPQTWFFNQFQVGHAYLLSTKALYLHAKDTKTRHTEIFCILQQQQKNIEGCTQLIPVQLQFCGNSVNPTYVSGTKLEGALTGGHVTREKKISVPGGPCLLSIKTLSTHTVQKLIVISNKFPRSFDSIFLSYVIDAY